jgi:hypothetical protein
MISMLVRLAEVVRLVLMAPLILLARLVLMILVIPFAQILQFAQVTGRALWSLDFVGEHFFVSGADHQVNATEPKFRIPVILVTFGNECSKKNLQSPKTSLD